MFGYNYFGSTHYAGLLVWMWEQIDKLTTAWSKISKPTTGWTEVWKTTWL